MGEPLSGQGPALWRKQSRNWLPGSPVDPDWPYALVWLNEDTCHVPLPMEGPLGVLSEGCTDSTTSGRSQPSGSLPASHLRLAGHAYPVGLNGCEDPIITSLPESLDKWHKPNWRQIHLSRGWHPTTHGSRPSLEGIAPWQMLLHPNG